MNFSPGRKTKPNWMLRGLIGISLVVHIIIFIHVAGLYHSSVLSFIEMTLDDISKPFSRDIPRPRLKQKTVEKPRDVKKLKVQKFRIPKMNIEPVNNNPKNTLMEDISFTNIPEISDVGIAALHPIGDVTYITSNDYYDMVRLRIESRKRYPDSARLKHMEGRITLKFVINQDGEVSAVEVVQGARHGILNTAAMEAVKRASPFPRPPANLFKGPLKMELTIMFELT